jgi:glycosyltransferase involved in cell wall biosynthesis
MARIVQIIGTGRPGGGTTAVLSLSRLLAAQGNEVVIFTQENSYLLEQAAVARLDAVGLDFSRRRNTVRIAAHILRHLQQLKPTVVHAHGARAALPTALIPRRNAWQFVYTVHGFHFRLKPPILRRLARRAEVLCIARADCTVFVSDGDFSVATQCSLLRRSREHRIIKNAVSVDCDDVQADKVYDIGFLGRLHRQKNPLILIDILKALLPLRPTLCVIGGGELEGALQSRIDQEGLGNQVSLHGECSHREALRMASSCRVLVLPSREEGHPIALIEAMHLGLPAVASDIPGNNEIVVDGETGYLVPASDVAAYADRLTRLLSDADWRRRMKDNAQQRAVRDYSVSRLLDAHLEIYARREFARGHAPASVWL